MVMLCAECWAFQVIGVYAGLIYVNDQAANTMMMNMPEATISGADEYPISCCAAQECLLSEISPTYPKTKQNKRCPPHEAKRFELLSDGIE